jgi:hypothetical protein
MVAPLAIAAGGLALKGVTGVMSYLDQKRAEQEAARLAGMPIDKYEATPELLNQYRIASQEVNTPQGYLPQERSRFQSQLNRILGAQNYNAQQIGGGGVARAINAIGSGRAAQAATDFAASDASLSRTNRNNAQSRLMNIINRQQQIKDMNTQAALSRRLMAEQATGRAIQQNKDYFRGMIGGLGNDLIGAGATMAVGDGVDPTTGMRRTPRFKMPKDLTDTYNTLDS